MKLVGDLVRIHARNLPTEEALVCGDSRYTYRELNAEVNRVASALLAAGVMNGDRVAVLSRNSVEYYCLYFALAKIGGVLVPLNWWHRAGQHAEIIDDIEPSIFCFQPEFAATAESALQEATQSPRPLLMPPTYQPAQESSDWCSFMSGATTDAEPSTTPDEDDIHLILYTSGTTGRPKGVMLSQRRTMDDAVSMAAVLGARQSDVYVTWSTPFHVGLWDHQKFFQVMGAKIVLLSHFEPGPVINAFVRERGTVLKAIPVMFDAVLNDPSFAAADLSAIRLVYYGAYDPSGVMDRVADAFGAREGRVEMVHTYGLTEGGCIVTACPADQVFSHWGSIGRPIPGVEVRLVGDDASDVAPGSPGELWMRGPMMSGYWHRPEESAAALAGGWLHTGDIAIADEDGFLRIADRKKDMIRTGGQNVYSKEVENCLTAHQSVETAAVIGLPDPVWEESVCAIVVPAAGAEPSDDLASDLIAWVRARIAGYSAPKRVIFAEALPVNALGKTLKADLRKQYGSMFEHSAHGVNS